mgnify:FL=1
MTTVMPIVTFYPSSSALCQMMPFEVVTFSSLKPIDILSDGCLVE